MNDSEMLENIEELKNKTKEFFEQLNKAFDTIGTEMAKQRAFMYAQLILDVVFALKILAII